MPYTPLLDDAAAVPGAGYQPQRIVRLTEMGAHPSRLAGSGQRVFTTHAGCYDQRRLWVQLRREGHTVGRQCLRV